MCDRLPPVSVQRFQDELQRSERHAWLKPAAEQVKRWREEDERNGQPWGQK